MTETLDEVTRIFGEAYETAAEAEEIKQDYQKRFFNLATQELSHRSLSQRTVEIPTGENAEAHIKLNYPGWVWIEVKTDGDKTWVLIRQDPALMKFTYINETDGKVYGRIRKGGKLRLDLELLKGKDPQLWREITEWPPQIEMLVIGAAPAAYHWLDKDFDQEDIDAFGDDWVNFILTKFNVTRVLRDPDTWTEDQTTRSQAYYVPSPVTVSLSPPRPIKPEDLDEETED